MTAHPATTVCVPYEHMAQVLSDLDAEVLVWDGHDQPPAESNRIEFWVPNYPEAAPDARVLGGFSGLRVLQLLSAGYEAWAPLVSEDVTLCNGRGIHGASTAELAVGGLIALLRGLPTYYEQQRARQWQRISSESLDGKRVLVLGAGDIGSRVASAVRVLGAEATLVARTAREDIHALVEVPALLPEHDVVVVALPHSPQTHHLVDAKFLASLRDGGAVVNIARGAIVDTDALLAELNAGRLRAFLDVTDPEPLPDTHPLWGAANLLLTPHVGGGTRGWARRAERLVHDQLSRHLAGQALANVVSGA